MHCLWSHQERHWKKMNQHLLILDIKKHLDHMLFWQIQGILQSKPINNYMS